MHTLPSELIELDNQQAIARVPVEVDARGAWQYPVTKVLGFDATQDSFNQAYCLAAIAIKCKEYNLAEQYMEIAERRVRAPFDTASLERLRLSMNK